MVALGVAKAKEALEALLPRDDDSRQRRIEADGSYLIPASTATNDWNGWFPPASTKIHVVAPSLISMPWTSATKNSLHP
jgi:hypothetical protein